MAPHTHPHIDCDAIHCTFNCVLKLLLTYNPSQLCFRVYADHDIAILLLFSTNSICETVAIHMHGAHQSLHQALFGLH